MGTYGYISIIAMFCYVFMLLTFLAAKKDKLVNSFLVVLVGQIFWTGGSVFMRMSLWPNYMFWFQVSLLGILLLPYAYCLFIDSFIGISGRMPERVYLIVMLVCFAINLPRGIFLQYPALVERNGTQYFEYDLSWTVAIFFVVAALILIYAFRNIVKACRASRNMTKQFEPIVLGMVLLFIGNLAIGLPFFKGFPIDILSGLLNAFLLLYALTRRKLFRLQMLASEGLCYVIGLGLALVLFFNLSPYIHEIVQRYIPFNNFYYPLIYAVLFLSAYLAFTYIWKVLVNNVFVKEELQQAEKLQKFSSAISKTLRLQEIMDKTIEVIKDTMSVDSIYICMQKFPGEPYKGLYSDRPLSDLSFTIDESNPLVEWLKKNEEPLIYREFRYTVEYKSMWESEKNQLEKMNVQCCVGLKDGGQLAGIILLGGSGLKNRLGYNDLQMLSSITSVASIAIKNARLYEQAYIEARTDELTGLLNRKYFYEVLNSEFEKNREGSLALVIFNVDDFKLYNQLYGLREGDNCLKRIADIIRYSVGENGYVARYSGKEFAILLPKYDVFSARNLTESICKQIYNMNNQERGMKLKSVTVSAGISAAPFAAKSVRELLDNVDLAIYHVKHSGKNGIQVFDTMLQNGDNLQAETNHAHIYQEYESTIYALTAAIDAKDHYTFSHCNNVAYYATELGRYLGMNEDVVEIIRQSALLHDVGKIGIPEGILNKAGALTDEEYEIIKGHVEASIDIIRHLPSLDYVIPAVIGHHERYDGKGYPRRIAGEDIPATARVLCIADSFDAMTSKRCYKKAFPEEKARKILLEEAGKQFDPDMVQAFVHCLDTGRIKQVDGEFSGNRNAC
ncbi:MAG: diguanylate cyclase [Lachnospiraceae bacterium]|nr:diguanylate cyclase [Lachnospiraceae bacterium]